MKLPNMILGFGGGLFFLFPFIALLVLFSMIGLASGHKEAGSFVGCFWVGFFLLILMICVLNWLGSKKDLDKEDYYGEYIINRDYFKGGQADWQYNHFRFEIKENDSLYFYVTEYDEVVETYRGTISTKSVYASERLTTTMEQPSHHVLFTNPTTYRSAWSFNLVFYSPKFNNMYFTKGKWKPIKD